MNERTKSQKERYVPSLSKMIIELNKKEKPVLELTKKQESSKRRPKGIFV